MSGRSRRVPLLLTMLVTVLLFLGAVSQAKVKQIQCQISDHDCPPEITSALHVLQEKSLIWNDIGTQVQVVVQPYTAYRFQAVTKTFPDTLTVFLEPQRLEYQVKLFQQESYLAANDQAGVVPLLARESIFTVIVSEAMWQTWTQQGTIKPLIHNQLKIVPSLLSKLNLQPENIVLLDEQNVVLYFANDLTAVAEIQQLESDLSRLTVVLQGLEERELPQPIQEIDLRFNQPVLRFNRNIPRHGSL